MAKITLGSLKTVFLCKVGAWWWKCKKCIMKSVVPCEQWEEQASAQCGRLREGVTRTKKELTQGKPSGGRETCRLERLSHPVATLQKRTTGTSTPTSLPSSLHFLLVLTIGWTQVEVRGQRSPWVSFGSLWLPDKPHSTEDWRMKAEEQRGYRAVSHC